jgi:hypothetical protein
MESKLSCIINLLLLLVNIDFPYAASGICLVYPHLKEAFHEAVLRRGAVPLLST